MKDCSAAVITLALLVCGCDSGGGRQRVPVRREDCVLCHQDDYEATTSPPHVGRFPTACAVCHSTNCVGCHEHERSRMADKHDEVSGYRADHPNPHFCLACHPSGFAEGD